MFPGMADDKIAQNSFRYAAACSKDLAGSRCYAKGRIGSIFFWKGIFFVGIEKRGGN